MSNTLLCENMSRLWASVLASEFEKLGAKDVFVAPGMRNAPLIAGFSNCENIKLHVGMDERGLSYQALGYAKSSGKPAVLLCTSGTAAANFYPAVIEASKTHVPLVVVSADRPPELAQTDANQTIDQKHLYGTHVKHFLDLGAPDIAISLRAIARMSAHAWEISTRAPAGPVHINISFREPLDGKKTQLPQQILEQAKSFAKTNAPSRQLIESFPFDIDQIAPFLKEASNPLIVIGELALCDVTKARDKLLPALKHCPHPLNVDVTSSVKFDFSLEDGLIPTFDHPEVFDYFMQNPPDLVVHIGGRLTSKHYYRYLNSQAGNFPVIHLTQSAALSDSAHAVTHHLNVDPVAAIIGLAKLWNKKPENKKSPFHTFIEKKIDVIEGSDKVAFPYLSKRIVEMIPSGHSLAIGNSTLIRSFDSYASQARAKEINVLTHRGVSGIEGFFASSSGCALATSKPVTLALGDVSAIHDLNSLELVARSCAPVICIVVNNYGGGIFTLLNLEKGEELYPIITSPHERQLTPIAKAFGLESFQVNSRTAFEEAYTKALTLGRSSFIEVMLDTQANNQIYQQLKTIKLS